MKLFSILEDKMPKSQEEMVAYNKAFTKQNIKDLEDALERAIHNDDDELANDLRAELKDSRAQVNEAKMPNNPVPRYQVLASAVSHQLDVFGEQLKSHMARQKQDPTNWGYVGDLEHVVEKLNILLDEFR